MKIAFTSRGPSWDDKVDPRFGRTEFLLIYDEETQELKSYDNREINSVAHGAGPQTAQKLFEMAPNILITGNGPGGNAQNILNRINLTIYTGAGDMTIREAYQAYQNNQLTKGGKNA